MQSTDEYELDQRYAKDVHEESVGFEPSAVPAAHMHFVGALLFGSWYSIILASGMSLGTKYLHPETPANHGILQSLAWAIGSGIAIAVASRLSRTHRLAVGICSSIVSASVWVALLALLRDDLDAATNETIFGHPLSVKVYLIGFAVLILGVGVISSFLGAYSKNDEELTESLLLVPSGHWLWLWIGALAWVSILPMVAYYVWLQIATVLYAIIHPSLWFDVGSGLLFGFIGIVALVKGIGMSLRAVSDKNAYGGVVWKRVSMFLVGTVLLASLVAPVAINLDLNRMKDMPASLGQHPWWLL